MQFRVPQFLDIEDKIFGPFTFSQFVYLAGGAGLCYVLLKLLGFLLALIPMLLVAGFALALTFYRPNNKPFIDMVESALRYSTQNKLYLWQRRKKSAEPRKVENKQEEGEEKSPGPKLTGGKLRDLAWSLDVLDLKQAEETRNRVREI